MSDNTSFICVPDFVEKPLEVSKQTELPIKVIYTIGEYYQVKRGKAWDLCVLLKVNEKNDGSEEALVRWDSNGLTSIVPI